MKPISEKEYIARHVEMAKESLANHIIIDRGEKRLVVGNPKCFSYRCSLLVEGCYLIMVGDLDTTVFAYGPPKLEESIRWMATPDVAYYVRQKAGIGMTGIGHEEFVREVALFEAMAELREAKDGAYGRRTIEAWDDIVGYIKENDDVNQVGLAERLYHSFDDPPFSIGICTSSRVLWAWSIICKANELLSTKDPTSGHCQRR